MKSISVDPARVVDVVHRALFLAYQASSVVGMGFLQARDDVTQDQFIAAITPRTRDNGIELYVDYGFGRMMKVCFTYRPNGDIDFVDGKSRPDYQSWARTYPTYESLLLKAVESCGCDLVRTARS